jgi:hypothetical protein
VGGEDSGEGEACRVLDGNCVFILLNHDSCPVVSHHFALTATYFLLLVQEKVRKENDTVERVDYKT